MGLRMNLKSFLKNNYLTKNLYARLQKHRHNKIMKSKLKGKYRFVNRSQGKEKLCVVLAGYKEFAYPAVFGRLKKYASDDIDVCVVFSGGGTNLKHCTVLNKLCQENNWSFLSLKKNNVALAQNKAISLHPNAKYIYKLDEDIFITKNYFSNLLKAFLHAMEGDYSPGVMAPIIPINGYGHLRILDRLGLREIYENRFEKPKYIASPRRKIENSLDVAKFFWDGKCVPSIDELNEKFMSEQIEERPCAIRFSIGAILFMRELWEDMGYFTVHKGSGMGEDEVDLCNYCNINSRPIMVSENVVVGHLSFGSQNAGMKDFYLSNPDIFLP